MGCLICHLIGLCQLQFKKEEEQFEKEIEEKEQKKSGKSKTLGEAATEVVDDLKAADSKTTTAATVAATTP